MKDMRQILSRPVVTEKSTAAKEGSNVVTFVVDKQANKCEIKDAVENCFKVSVETVRTINVAGKTKRTGKTQGRRASWKKAFVELKAGESIDIFEGV